MGKASSLMFAIHIDIQLVLRVVLYVHSPYFVVRNPDISQIRMRNHIQMAPLANGKAVGCARPLWQTLAK